VGWPNPNLAKQSPVFHTMGRRAGFRWGGQRGGNSLAAREGSAAVRSERAGLFCGFVLCNPLFCIVVPVLFVCCSVKLPLSRPTSFCLFLSILLRTPVGGGAAAWRFCCRLQPKPKHHLWQMLCIKLVLLKQDLHKSIILIPLKLGAEFCASCTGASLSQQTTVSLT